MNSEKYTKHTVILFFLLFLIVNALGYAQCSNPSNPVPTGNTSQDFCSSDNNLVADLVASGGMISWYDMPSGGSPLPSSALLFTGIYYADDVAGNACSPNRLAVNVTIFASEPVRQVAATFCQIDNPTINNLFAIGTNLEWFDNQTGGTALVNNTPLIDGAVYWVQQTENGCISNRVSTAVTVLDPPSPILSSSQSFCLSDNPTVADIVATTSDPSNMVIWYDDNSISNPISTSTPLIDGEDYWAAELTDATFCESTIRSVVTVSIQDTAAPIVNNTNQEFCLLDNPTIANLAATGSNIQWYDTAMSMTAFNTTDALIDGEDYYATQTDSTTGCESFNRTVVTVTVSDIIAPSVSSNSQQFCAIDNPTIADIDVTGSNIRWYDTATSTTPLIFSDVLLDGEDYFATQTDTNSGCDSSNRTVVTVSIQDIAAPMVGNNIQEFCVIDNPTVADLNASGSNIQWYDTSTSTTPLNTTDTLTNGQDYFATQTDTTTGCESTGRTVVNVLIQDTIAPTVNNSNQEFCLIDDPTVADIVVTGTNVQWYDTATSNTPLNNTDMLVDGEDYWATQTDTSTGCESSTRTLVTVTVQDSAVPMVSSSSQVFCDIDNPTVADLDVSGLNVQWYDTVTSTAPLNSTDTLIDGEDYYATQTDTSTGCESSNRTQVNVSVQNNTAPTVNSNAQEFCVIDNPTIANLNVTGSNIQWYDSASSNTPLNTADALIDGEDYYATQTDSNTGCESANRTVVVVTIQDTAAPTVNNNNQEFCAIDNPTITNLMASGSNIQWYDTSTDTTPLNINDTLIDGEDYYATQTDANTGCESSSRTVITVIINDTTAPIVANASEIFCEADNPTVGDLIATGSNIQWYDTATTTAPLNTTDILVDGEDYWATQTDAITSCESSTRTLVTVFLDNPMPAELIPQGNEFCLIDNPTIADLNNNAIPSENAPIIWFDSFPNGIELMTTTELIDGNTYYGIQLGALNGCESTQPLIVQVDLSVCDEVLVFWDGFSPDGDGINDTYDIENIELLYPDYEIKYYNRWGNIVYNENATNSSWNGRLNGDGELAPVGVYYYIVYFNKNQKKPLQGRLYLSR